MKTRIVAAAVLLIEMERIRRERRRKRKCWVRKWIERRALGMGALNMLLTELREENPEDFQNFTRLNEFMFNDLLERIKSRITKQDTNMRNAIPPEERLAATLDFLASGTTFERAKFSCRIAPNTLSLIVFDTLRATVDVLGTECIKTPQTAVEWDEVANNFEVLWNFPHCLGALDGKHINFRPPRTAGSHYRNYKKTDSIVLMALVDAHYRFIFIDVGKNGRCNDSTVFKESKLWEGIQTKTLNIPQPSALSNSEEVLPYVIVGDDAFALNDNLMKPYPERGLTHDQNIFNYRLSRARRIVENAFGHLANRFQILLKAINLSVEKVELITVACCILHNFIMERQPNSNLTRRLCDGLDGDGNPLPILEGLPSQGGNRTSMSAQEYRNKFRRYFNNEGKVPWQEKAIESGNF